MRTSALIAMLMIGLNVGCAQNRPKLTAVDHFAIAVSAHKYDEARQLLAAGTDPNGFLADGATPLFVAAHGKDASVVRFLLESGADPNKAVPQYDNWTPLMAAAKQGSPEIIVELLRHGADPGHHDKFNQTAVTIAQGRGDAVVIDTLAGNGTKEE